MNAISIALPFRQWNYLRCLSNVIRPDGTSIVGPIPCACDVELIIH